MRRSTLTILLIFTFVMTIAANGALAEVKIGVLAKRGPSKCMQAWGATGQYLSEKLGTPVRIVPLKYDAIKPAVAHGKIDFVLANSALFVELEKDFSCRAVATLINSHQGNALNEFGGVILVRQDSPITTLAGIRGKKLMVVEKSSFGGGQMAWRLLNDNGIDPETDCTELMFGTKQDNVVLSVQEGICDVGCVRSDTLERMADEGLVNLADFRVIDPIEDDFPFARSTRLYPEWPMAALKATDPVLAQSVAQELKDLRSSDAAALSARIVGWADPADYCSVRECLTVIQYGAFADIQ